MGKDNVPFHTIMFPGSLIGTGKQWTLLDQISTTEYLNYENIKFSKRNSTGVFGTNVIEIPEIPVFAWRFYLLSIRPENSDTQFRWTDFQTKINNELVNNIGNLYQRVLALLFKNHEGELKSFNKENIDSVDEQFLKEI